VNSLVRNTVFVGAWPSSKSLWMIRPFSMPSLVSHPWSEENKGFELIRIQSFSQENIELTPLRHFNYRDIFKIRRRFERSIRIGGS
jgi:hypothetical protein